MGARQRVGDHAPAGRRAWGLRKGDVGGVGLPDAGLVLPQLDRQFGEAGSAVRRQGMPVAIHTGATNTEPVRDHLETVAGRAGKIDLGARMQDARRCSACAPVLSGCGSRSTCAALGDPVRCPRPPYQGPYGMCGTGSGRQRRLRYRAASSRIKRRPSNGACGG